MVPSENCNIHCAHAGVDGDSLWIINIVGETREEVVHLLYLRTEQREAEISELLKDIKWASDRNNASIVKRLQAALVDGLGSVI